MTKVRGRSIQNYIWVLITAWSAIASAAADNDASQVISNRKLFADTGDIVRVEGTLTGYGIVYKSNRAVLTCHRQSRECKAVQIEIQGAPDFSIYPSVSYNIRVWTANRIVAEGARLCRGGFETWTIDRRKQTATLTEHLCSDAGVYHWTMEDPPIWRKNKPALDPK
jgi:hypothetical protein